MMHLRIMLNTYWTTLLVQAMHSVSSNSFYNVLSLNSTICWPSISWWQI